MTNTQKIGILKTGEVKPEWQHEFGDYSTMFDVLFRRVSPNLEFQIYDVPKGEYPQSPAECDGYIITGSRYGVYDDLDWIEPLLNQIRTISAAGVPQAGVCFGHQALATAFGGKVLKSPKGWGVGVHDYRTNPQIQIDALKPGEVFSLLATHQDQVVEAPADATVSVTSDFCPIAGLISHKHRYISFQGHPEFTREFHCKLLEDRIRDIGEPVVATARLSLSRETDETRVALSILKFIEQIQEKRQERKVS